MHNTYCAFMHNLTIMFIVTLQTLSCKLKLCTHWMTTLCFPQPHSQILATTIVFTASVSSTISFFFFFFFLPHHLVCEILIPWPGIKPRPSAVEAQSPNHWTARKLLSLMILGPSCKWNCAVFVVLWLTYYTFQDVLKVHLCCVNKGISFLSKTESIVYYLCIPHFFFTHSSVEGHFDYFHITFIC